MKKQTQTHSELAAQIRGIKSYRLRDACDSLWTSAHGNACDTVGADSDQWEDLAACTLRGLLADCTDRATLAWFARRGIIG